jgi:starch synthase (maltosyl-transferring)
VVGNDEPMRPHPAAAPPPAAAEPTPPTASKPTPQVVAGADSAASRGGSVSQRRFPIEDIRPTIDGGAYPAKAVVGEHVPISAVVYREGHDALGCVVTWRGPDGERPAARMTAADDGTGRWHATIQPDAVGAWEFSVEAFSDPYLTWHHAVLAKIEAGQGTEDLVNDIARAAAVLDRAVAIVPEEHTAAVKAAAAALRDDDAPLSARIEPALDLALVLWAHPVRDLVTASESRPLWVDRTRALFSAWYEMFPRSEGDTDANGRAKHGTFATAARRLPAIAQMGFDIVYLPPIHPIGKVNRKGRNNSLRAAPGDVGSPWAIGSSEGGHDAIHPELGTLDDLRTFIARAHDAGLEVAMDLALQCAPDHPWVSSHPEWFTTLPDGTIAYAENPPKKYQDIYPLNFDNDPDGIRAEIRRIVLHWVAAGIKVFRVDNPHTKPVNFWHWLIAEVKAVDPDALFLAEAFTAPPMMHGLGRAGFTQSYTYFTWRNTAAEMREYCEELVAAADHMRPNFWPTTPDILPEPLQHAGPAMFKVRAILASMLSPSWGIYSGYELYENVNRPGAEELLDNEKYELRPRAWAAREAAGESLAPYLGALNAIRGRHPSLHWLRNLRFHGSDNPAVLCFSKRDEDSGDTIIVAVSFDPQNVAWANISLDMPALGFDWHQRFTIRDELTGAVFDWGEHNPVRLDPYVEPAHILSVQRAG